MEISRFDYIHAILMAKNSWHRSFTKQRVTSRIDASQLGIMYRAIIGCFSTSAKNKYFNAAEVNHLELVAIKFSVSRIVGERQISE